MSDFSFSWIVEEQDGQQLQINGDRAEIQGDTFAVYGRDSKGVDYLIGATQNWARIDVMSQVTGYRNGFVELYPTMKRDD